MQHVMDTRKQQLEEKCSPQVYVKFNTVAEVARQKAEAEKETKELVRIFEEHKKIEKQQEEERKQVCTKHIYSSVA